MTGHDSDDDIMKMLMTLPSEKRHGMLIQSAFSGRQLLPISREWFKILAQMAAHCSMHEKATLADLARDFADQIEQPLMKVAK